MSTPGGIKRYTELMQSTKPPELVPVATAFVIDPEVEGGRLMTAHFTNIYASINRPFKAFETLDQAQAWVQSIVLNARAAS